jgi:hypothetical protein
MTDRVKCKIHLQGESIMAQTNDCRCTVKSGWSLPAVLTALVFIAAFPGAPATPLQLTELEDRAAIEDLFNDYYSQFGPDSKHDFASFFTADGRLKVNGLVANNPEEIKAMYALAGAGGEGKEKKAEGAVPEGVSEMMYTNLRIRLEGDRAVATLLWHSVRSDPWR